jgi:hypothetical protein
VERDAGFVLAVSLVKVLVDASSGGEDDEGFDFEDDGKKGQGYPDLSTRFLCSSLQVLFKLCGP